MGAWLQSKTGREFRLRDGTELADPVFIVGPEPVYFKTKNEKGYANDHDVEPVKGKKAASDSAYDKQVEEHKKLITADRASRPNAARRKTKAFRSLVNSFSRDTDVQDSPEETTEERINALGRERVPNTGFTATEDDD